MKNIARITIATTLLGFAGLAQAVTLPYYSATYPTPNAACATYGNVVSCSTKVLDYLVGEPGFVGPYGFSAAQGSLIDTVVIATNGGNILDNGDQVTPSEDSFKTITPRKDYFFTGDGNDPENNGALAGDTAHSWDIGVSALIDKLTFDGAFHQLLFALDFNNPQSQTANLPIWAMMTFRNADGTKQISFETQALDTSGGAATIFKDPSLHTTSKVFDPNNKNTPSAGDFATTVGSICVLSPTDSYPSPDGANCPDGGTIVSTNRASNEIEFINYLPSMDLNALFAEGYTNMSMQVWMGCFGQIDKGNPGPALADGGSIGPCDTGGFGDIFLLAGAVEPGTNVPEPGSLALIGLSLLGLGFARRRKQ